jgi:hypothetical protein
MSDMARGCLYGVLAELILIVVLCVAVTIVWR